MIVALIVVASRVISNVRPRSEPYVIYITFTEVVRTSKSLYFTCMSIGPYAKGNLESDLGSWERRRLALLDHHSRRSARLERAGILHIAHAAAASILRFDAGGHLLEPTITGNEPWRGFAYQVLETTDDKVTPVGCGIRIAATTLEPGRRPVEVYSDVPLWMDKQPSFPFAREDAIVVAGLLDETRLIAPKLSLAMDLATLNTMPNTLDELYGHKPSQ
jgi:hypothetical protein